MRALQPQTGRHVKPLLPHSSAVELPSISSSEEGDKRSDADTRGDWEDKRRQSARETLPSFLSRGFSRQRDLTRG